MLAQFLTRFPCISKLGSEALEVQVLKKEGDAKLLLCAPQGYSADLLASALGAAGLKPTEMMRLADPRHPPVQMKEVRQLILTLSHYRPAPVQEYM